MNKKCPFTNEECSSDCSLFVSTEDLNEFFAARLSSLGVVDRSSSGSCSFKMLAMSGGRFIFENSTTQRL